MLDHARGKSLLLEPAGGASMQLGLEPAFDAPQLGEEELAEERVIPEPPSLPVERHEEEVEDLEPSQGLRSVLRAQHDVAERNRPVGHPSQCSTVLAMSSSGASTSTARKIVRAPS